MPILASFLVVMLLGGGTAAAAEGSRPGDVLYPVKVNVTEKVTSAFALNDEARAEAEARFAERRLLEASELAAEGKLSSDIKARLETRFDTHAQKVEARIAMLQEKGSAVKAAELASRFEASLRAHQAILARVSIAHASTSVIVEPLEEAIGARLGAIGKIRAEVERGIKDANGNGRTEEAAEGRIKAVEKVIAASERFVAAKKIVLGANATAEAEAKLAQARDLRVQASAKLEADAYAESFIIAGNALRTAQEARLLVRANDDSARADDDDDNEEEDGDNVRANDDGDDDERESAEGIETQSGARVHLDEDDIESNVESLLRLGL